jgi:hypothetical protein
MIPSPFPRPGLRQSSTPDGIDDAAAEKLLRQKVREAGGEQAWAIPRGLTGAAVSNVLSGRRQIGPRMARALGLRLVVVRRFVGGR